MKRLFAVSLFIILLVCACTGPQQTIKPDEVYEDDKDPIAISCIQDFMKDQQHFQSTFKMNMEMPELVLTIKPSFLKLEDESREMALAIVGTKWHECYGADNRPLTVWAMDSSDSIVTVIFVTKDEGW